ARPPRGRRTPRAGRRLAGQGAERARLRARGPGTGDEIAGGARAYLGGMAICATLGASLGAGPAAARPVTFAEAVAEYQDELYGVALRYSATATPPSRRRTTPSSRRIAPSTGTTARGRCATGCSGSRRTRRSRWPER